MNHSKPFDAPVQTHLKPQASALTVAYFMHSGLETCSPDTSLKSVIGILSQKNIGSILIESDGEIDGIWTRTDLLRLDLTRPQVLQAPISMVMNSPVSRIHQDELISSATYLFHKKHIHHLLVVDCDERPVGVVTQTDLVNAKASEYFLEGVSISELLDGHLHFIDATAGLDAVLAMMAEKDVDALVVQKGDRHGIVSMRDLLKCFSERDDYLKLSVADIASWPLISVPHTQSLAYVRNFMIERNFHHIGVVDEDDQLMDLISFAELLHRIEESFHFQTSLSIKEKEQRVLEAETLYRDLLSMSMHGVLIYQDDRIAYANHPLYKLLGYQECDLMQKSLMDLVPPVEREAFAARLHALEHQHPTYIEQALVCQDGGHVMVELAHKPITYHAEPAHLVMVNDLTQHHESERFRMLTRSVFDNAGEGILVTDADNRFVLVNRKFEDITGYAFEDVMGQDPAMLSSGKQNKAFYAEMWQSLAESGTWQGEIWNRKKDGTIYPEWLTINAVKSRDGEVLHYVGLMNDLSQQKATEQEINRLSFYDILTGLPNVSLFKNRLQQSIKTSSRESQKVALLIVDIARFKMVNDAVGYEYGDKLLKAVAHRLSQLLDTEDSVARLGADNFMILLEAIKGKDEVGTFADQLIEAFMAPFNIDDQDQVLDIKIGIALSSLDGEEPLDLMKSADEALYEAKKLPHSGYAFHSTELTTSTSEYFFYEKALRQGLENKELVAYFQPQISLTDQSVIGAEALVRWLHPEMGVVPPSKFIGVGESTGLIIPLGREVLAQACRQWQAWEKQGLALERISVNVSTIQLMHQGFVESVADVLAETGLNPSVLELEVTESFLLQNEQQGIEVLHALKALGVSLSMDDFGTGFSSLSYLKKLPLDQLKIDQSFIQSLPDDAEDLAIVEAIIAVGQAVGVEVIAEGVETEAQAAFLLEKGCLFAQGYRFSRPLPAEDFFNWWTQFKPQ